MDQSRDKIIVRTSIIGIVANAALAVFKAIIGVLTGSIAITMDAVNNLSDAASSVITIVGTKLAGKEPDKKHPFGYGRIEYMSAMLISLIVLYAGITSLQESVKKIIHPETPTYTTISIVIVAVAVVVKIVLGKYVKATGEKVNSDSLINSGADALLDSVISAATVVAAVIFVFTGISIEAWLGAIISLVIIKSGIDMIRETISQILGEGADVSLVRDIKNTVASFEGVNGAYDLVMNNYGPDTYNASIHVEIPDTYSADQVDELTRRIQVEVFKKYNVYLTAISVYSYNTKDPEISKTRDQVKEIALSVPNVLQMHGFFMNVERKIMRFDLVVSFESDDRDGTFAQAMDKIKEAYPEYDVTANMDMDYNEL